MWDRPKVGNQSFLRVETQISPEWETLGWNNLVVKKPVSCGLEAEKKLEIERLKVEIKN